MSPWGHIRVEPHTLADKEAKCSSLNSVRLLPSKLHSLWPPLHKLHLLPQKFYNPKLAPPAGDQMLKRWALWRTLHVQTITGTSEDRISFCLIGQKSEDRHLASSDVEHNNCPPRPCTLGFQKSWVSLGDISSTVSSAFSTMTFPTTVHEVMNDNLGTIQSLRVQLSRGSCLGLPYTFKCSLGFACHQVPWNWS